MANYRSKPVEVDAECYRSGLEDEWALLWRDNVLIGRYETRQAAESCPHKRSPGFYGETVPVLVTPTGRVALKPGDWIVTDDRGERRAVGAAVFNTTYEPR